MVGLYPDAPGPQIMYDLDGSSAFVIPAGSVTPTVLTQAQAKSLLNISNDGYTSGNLQSGGVRYGVLFPALTDLVGYAIAHQGDIFGNGVTISALATSVDTTNGYDGTWTTQVGSPAWTTSITLNYRTVGALAVSGVIAVRFTASCAGSGSGTCYAFQIYGKPSTGAALDRLRLWHPTLDQEMSGAGLDYGDFGRGGTIDRTFRVKNNSSSLSAHSIVLSFEALPADASPTVESQMSLSQGGSFASTQNIGTLAPGEISGICTLRIATTGSTALGLWRQRLIVAAGSWT